MMDMQSIYLKMMTTHPYCSRSTYNDSMVKIRNIILNMPLGADTKYSNTAVTLIEQLYVYSMLKHKNKLVY